MKKIYIIGIHQDEFGLEESLVEERCFSSKKHAHQWVNWVSKTYPDKYTFTLKVHPVHQKPSFKNSVLRTHPEKWNQLAKVYNINDYR